jgi:putative membrane protein
MKKILMVSYVFVLVWSGVNPRNQFVWFLEVAPALIGAGVILYTYRTFPLTPFLYLWILIHCFVLMIGGHYTYAEVPLFSWLQDWFDLQRNNYDKLGHFVQGFVPALIAREIFIRKGIIAGRGWLNFLVICFCLAVSGFYELLEWWVALLAGEDAETFLATQGYVWDTQADMGFALLGAILALVCMSRFHDRAIAELTRQIS